MHANDNQQLRPVVGFEGIYSVTDDGRVFSHPRIDARGNRRKGKWLKPIPDGDGYPRVHLCMNGVRRKWQIHRLVAFAFIPNPEGKPAVNHKDGVKSNNCVSNLEWVTNQENIIHALKLGLIIPVRDIDTGQYMGKAA